MNDAPSPLAETPRTLTKRTVDALAPGEMAWDGIVKGFVARRQTGDSRVYYVKYRVGRGRAARQRWLKIGTHGSPWTVETARGEAKRILGAVAHGDDPAAERSQAKGALTVDAFADRYLAEHAEPKKKPSSVVMDRLNLKVHVRPALGHLGMADVTRSDVARLVHDLRATPGTANRCLALLSKMMNLAEAWGVRPDGSNPCRHVEKFPERKRERFLSIAELGKLGTALAAAEAKGGSAVYLAGLVRLLVLSGARLGEIRTARWEWIDLETGVLRLPDSKTGAKVVHLPAPALAVLAQLPRVEGNPHVIAGAGKAPIVETFRFWEGVREAAGLVDVRLHDLRHSFASVGASSGLGLPILGKLLGHSKAGTTMRYAHLDNDPLKAAANRIGGAIDAAMSGKAPGQVVPLQRSPKAGV